MNKIEFGSGNKNMTPLQLYEETVRMMKMKDDKWKYFAIATFGCLVLAIAVLAWAVSLPKTVPLVISVSDWGEAKYVGDVSKLSYSGMKIPDVAIEYQLTKFVKKLMEVSTDSSIVKENLIDCYASVTQVCSEKLTAQLKADDPRSKVGKTVRKVDVESILKLSNKSYQVDFIVNDMEKNGKLKSKSRMRGVLELDFLEPVESDKILNPLGIYISNYDFTIVSITGNGK